MHLTHEIGRGCLSFSLNQFSMVTVVNYCTLFVLKQHVIIVLDIWTFKTNNQGSLSWKQNVTRTDPFQGTLWGEPVSLLLTLYYCIATYSTPDLFCPLQPTQLPALVLQSLANGIFLYLFSIKRFLIVFKVHLVRTKYLHSRPKLSHICNVHTPGYLHQLSININCRYWKLLLSL